MGNKFFLIFFLSTLLISCSGGGSSNIDESLEVNSDGNTTTVAIDDVQIKATRDGVPTIVEDPRGKATITQNPDGSSTIDTGQGSTVLISADGTVTSIDSPRFNGF